MTERSRVYQDAYGVRRTLIVDDERPGFVVKTSQDIEPLLDSVARDRELMRNDGPSKVVARIPVSIFERSVHEQWDEEDWKRFLNSSEAAPFRVWQGRV